MSLARLAALFAVSVCWCAPGVGQAARAVWEAGPLDQDPDLTPWGFLRIEGPTARGRLAAFGDFERVGNVAATGLAIWDGESWESVTTALRPATVQAERAAVRCAVVFDDGSGEALYFGGSFTDVSGSIRNVARWRGGVLEGVGGGLGAGLISGQVQEVRALVVHDDGSGAALYAGGSFNVAGEPRYLARWRGGGWETVGGVEPSHYVYSLWSEGEGDLEGLYAAGSLTTIGSTPVRYVARWDGTAWRAMDRGLPTAAGEMVVFDRGDGAGRQMFTSRLWASLPVWRWTGETWVEDGEYARGGFAVVRAEGEEHVYRIIEGEGIARLDNGVFVPLVQGQPLSIGWPVSEYDRGWGEGRTVICGSLGGSSGQAPIGFTDVGRTMVLHEGGWARLNGSAGWMTGAAAFDFGEGVRLVASRRDWLNGRATVYQWDFERLWRDFSASMPSGPGNLLRMHRLGTGDGSVYASSGPSGYPYSQSDVSNGLFRWRGGVWEIAGGAAGSTIAQEFSRGNVYDSVVFDDGSGPAIYVCGTFRLPLAGGGVARGVARWDGSAWSAVGELGSILITSAVSDLEVFDDGTGAALYAFGKYWNSSFSGTRPLARWDGSAWTVDEAARSSFAEGTFARLPSAGGDRLLAMSGDLLAERAQGAWTALSANTREGNLTLVRQSEGVRAPSVAGGVARPVVLGFRSEGVEIQRANVFPVLRRRLPMAAWDGERWSYVRVDVGASSLHRLVTVDRGDHDEVWLAGSFSMLNGAPAQNLARLVALETTCAGDADFSGVVDMADLSIVLGAFGMATPITNDPPHPADLDVSEKVDFRDLMIVLGNFGRACPARP